MLQLHLMVKFGENDGKRKQSASIGLLVTACVLASCAYDTHFDDCAVRCTSDLECPSHLSCESDDGSRGYRLCRSAEVVCGDITSDLAGWWKLDEGSGSSTADASSNGNIGTLQNAPLWTTGPIENALAFNGIDQYVSIADSYNLRVGGTNVLTLTAWIRRGTSTAVGGIFEKRLNAGGYGLALGVTPCAPNQIKATKYSVVEICLGSAPDDTTWHHFALVYSGSGVIAYVDGIQNATYNDTQNFVTSSDNLKIGTAYSAYYFNGSIDDVRIYNRALSAAEIMMLQ